MRRSHRFSIGVAFTALLLVLAGSGSGATADDAEVTLVEPSFSVPLPATSVSVIPTVRADAGSAMSEHEAEDLAVLARDQGLSRDEIVANYGASGPFNRWLEGVRATYPDDFAGAEWLAEEGIGWVGFSERAPVDVLDEARLTGVRVKVSEDMGFSEKELLADVRELAERDEVAPALGSVAPEPRDGSLRLTLREGVGADPSLVASSLKKSGVERPVRVVRATSPPMTVNIDHLRGGGRLTDCTAGFVVRAFGGAKGVATANHCHDVRGRNSISYNNWPIDSDGTAATLWWDRGGYGVAGDTGVYKSGSHSSLPSFYVTTQTKRYVEHAARGVPSRRSPVVKFGSTTHQTSGVVYDTGVTAELCLPAGGCVGTGHNMVSATYSSSPGDSGGPVYYGSMALGIHSSNNGLLALFSPVSHLGFSGYGVWER